MASESVAPRPGAYAEFVEVLKQSTSSGKWQPSQSGLRVLRMPLGEIEQAENISDQLNVSLPPDTILLFLQELPDRTQLSDILTEISDRELLVWPDIAVGHPALATIGFLACLGQNWPILRLKAKSPEPNDVKNLLMDSPTPSPDELTEDLDAREKWFRKRH